MFPQQTFETQYPYRCQTKSMHRNSRRHDRMFQNGLFTRILQRILRDTVHGINQERYHYHRHFKGITKQTRWRQNQIPFALARKEETLVSLDLNCLFLFYFSAFKHNEPFVLPSLSTCGCCCILKTGAYGVSLT